MSLKAKLKWNYAPPDYFEAPFKVVHEDIPIRIEPGHIIAEVAKERLDENQSLHDSLSFFVESLFIGVQIASHEDYEINRGPTEIDRPDGGTNIVVGLKTAELKITAYPPDIKIADAEGKVIKDTKQDRIDAKQTLAALIASARGADSTLNAILHSYAYSVKEPSNELIYLFEIREAIAQRFGGEKEAKAKLAISSKKWSRLGRLANNDPLNQGRHRGRRYDELRDATEEELNDARAIAREIVVKYARWLV